MNCIKRLTNKSIIRFADLILANVPYYQSIPKVPRTVEAQTFGEISGWDYYVVDSISLNGRELYISFELDGTFVDIESFTNCLNINNTSVYGDRKMVRSLINQIILEKKLSS